MSKYGAWKGGGAHLLGYDDFRSLNMRLAVTFSRIRFRAVWSNRIRNLSHWETNNVYKVTTDTTWSDSNNMG